MSTSPRARKRCAWARNPLCAAYHDREWGVPVRSDRKLFEFLILEGAQAGLAWDTILAKRASYRRAFDRFDAATIARYGARERRRLLADAGIVRNRAKVRAAIANARAFLAVQAEHGSFAAYVWAFVDGQPLQGRRRSPREVPAETALSQALSADLKARGFGFVGPTICYAFMQAVGLVNDHTLDCCRHDPVARLAGRAARRALGPARLQVLVAGFAPAGRRPDPMTDPRVRALMRSPRPEYEWHSGEVETAMMLSVAPRLVRRAAARRLPPAWVDWAAALARGVRRFERMQPGGRGYFGWPAAARADTGRRAMALRGRLIAAALLEELERWPRGVVRRRRR